MVTIAQLESWKPERLSSIADDLNTRRGKLVDLQDELDAGKPPASWVGADSYYAEQKHLELAEQIVDDVAEIATVISALDTAATDIGSAKSSLEGALSSAEAAGFKVDRTSGRISDPTVYEDDRAAQHAGLRISALAEQMSSALEDAAAADTALADALARASRGQIDVDGDLGSLGLDAQLRGTSPAEQAAYLLDHPERGREILDALPPAVKKEIGSQLSDLTDDIMDPNKDIDADFLENLNELQDAYGEDPAIATSFLDTMGPEKMVELNGWIANLQMDDDFPEDFTSYDHQMEAGLAQQMGSLQTNLGQLLGAGTAGLDGDGQPGSDTHVSSDWVQRLVATGDDEVPFGYQGQDGDYTHKMYGYQLIAPLLHSADSGYLLNEVGDGMLKFETDFAKEHGALPWSFPIMNEDGLVEGGRTDGVDQTGEWDGVRLDWTQGTGEDDQAGFDPMGGLLDGLSRNPDAARDFFTGDDVPVGFRDGDDTTWRDESRVDYLLTDREWGPDHTNWSNVNMAEAQGPGNEEYLGDALRSATMDDPVDGPSREQVRDILQETVHAIASDEQVSGHGNLDLGDDTTTSFSETDWVRPGLRDDLADILGHHSETVHQTFENGGGEAVGPYDVRWDDKELTRVLADLGKDPSANETLRHAEYAEAIHQMKSGMEGYDQPGLVAENDGRALAKVMSALDYGAVRSEIEESTTADEDHNTSVTGKADLARGIVDLIPTGKNPLVGAVTDAGLGSLISGWEEANQVDHIGDRNYSTGELLTARRDMTEELVREVIRDYSTDDEVITNAANDAGDAYAGEYGWAQNIIESER
ncbi:MAG: DUF6571 family protein [Nocardioides sp.]